MNLGHEQSGQENFLRPVLIIKKVGSLYFTIPLSSQAKISALVFALAPNPKLKSSSVALLGHAKTIDLKRLNHKI